MVGVAAEAACWAAACAADADWGEGAGILRGDARRGRRHLQGRARRLRRRDGRIPGRPRWWRPVPLARQRLGFLLEDRQGRRDGLHRQVLVHPDRTAGERDVDVAIPLCEFEHGSGSPLRPGRSQRNPSRRNRPPPDFIRPAAAESMSQWNAHFAERERSRRSSVASCPWNKDPTGFEDDLIGGRFRSSARRLSRNRRRRRQPAGSLPRLTAGAAGAMAAGRPPSARIRRRLAAIRRWASASSP